MNDYKHEPVDDYPYICYAPEVDANTDDISGGGGGGGGGYVLPIASASDLGGVKVGENLEIDSSGVLSASNLFIIPFNTTTAQTEKTYAEIEAAFLAGKTCLIDFSEDGIADYRIVTGVKASDGGYYVANLPISSAYCLITNDRNGYPAD